MPPSTFVRRGFSAGTASLARFTICANKLQSGSTSKSQCDLLLGSFQNITESTIHSSFKNLLEDRGRLARASRRDADGSDRAGRDPQTKSIHLFAGYTTPLSSTVATRQI